MKTFLFLCFGVVSFFVGFLTPYIISRFKNKKVTNSQQENPLFKKGDIITYEEYYNNPFGAKHYWYLVMDVQIGGNGKWYYKYIKCNYAGIPEPRAQYGTGIMYPGVFVKVGFVALS